MKKYISKLLLLLFLTTAFCIAISCVFTSAYFSQAIVSGVNTIQSASYDLDITVMQGDTVVDLADGNISAGVYSVFLEPKENNAKQGFCIIQIDDQIYYTSPVENGKTYSFSLSVETNSLIKIDAHWGKAENDPHYSGAWNLISLMEITTTDVNGNR